MDPTDKDTGSTLRGGGECDIHTSKRVDKISQHLQSGGTTWHGQLVCRTQAFVFKKIASSFMQGSYHVGNTASRPISEVKQRWALLVTGVGDQPGTQCDLAFFSLRCCTFFTKETRALSKR